MTDPGYNLVEIVDAVRRAGNPQKAALEALASVAETSRAWLAGWDALRGMLMPAPPKDTRKET